MNKWTWRRERVAEVDSTNRLAGQRVLALWAQGNDAHGLVITADRQTAGRGQHGRRWESPAGGLYLSAVLENVPREWRDRLALVAGVAAIEALDPRGQRGLLLRWPNDLVVVRPDGMRKVAGILCEGVAQADRWAAVVGIGVNVLETPLPEELRSIATSLEALGWRPLEAAVERCAHELLAGLARVIEQRADLESLVRRAATRDALRGKRVRVDPHVHDSAPWEGRALGLAPDGALLVERAGQTQTVSAATVRAIE